MSCKIMDNLWIASECARILYIRVFIIQKESQKVNNYKLKCTLIKLKQLFCNVQVSNAKQSALFCIWYLICTILHLYLHIAHQ